jgi:NADPH:quinone reductase-like Zn-dependent oxidoreductase
VYSNRSGGHLSNQVLLNGFPVACDLIQVEPPSFDPQLLPDQVLVKVKAFSCNFRDKALMIMAAQSSKSGYYIFGSEFVGEVMAVGSLVSTLQPGDRVIPNGSWPVSADAQLGGLPTNHGAKEYQLFRPGQLLKIPPQMSDEDAAAFTIGAQTTYSMIRRLDIPEGAHVLVTAAKSNTSLFAIQALQKRNVEIYALSTSSFAADRLTALGVKQVFVIDPAYDLQPQIGRTFTYIIDPFYDIYLPLLITVMDWGAKYTTCGFYAQAQKSAITPEMAEVMFGILSVVMIKNIQIIGNCLGTTEDLLQALDDYAAGNFRPVIDSTFGNNDVAAFLDRTYNAPDRFGKVVFMY